MTGCFTKRLYHVIVPSTCEGSNFSTFLPKLSLSCYSYPSEYIGEGSGNPLQYSCLENPMDKGAWQAAVHEVAKSRTRLSNFTFMHWRRKWQPTPVFLLGDPRDGGAWWAAVYGVAQSRTQLKQLSSSSSNQSLSPSQCSIHYMRKQKNICTQGLVCIHLKYLCRTIHW